MLPIRRLCALAAVCFLAGEGILSADPKALHPQVRKILDDVSESRVRGIIEKLVSFETRNTLSAQDDPKRGIGAARQWIFNELQSYSPRLQVRFEKFRVKKQGRVFKDVDLWNVIAVLPGTRTPEAQVIVSAHYDSLNLGDRAAGAPAAPGTATANGGERPPLSAEDYERTVNLPAPGACDDGSGTAAVMELARVMSQHEFGKTLVFVAFAGEEQGLIGATLQAAKAKADNIAIEAVLNNDIIGTELSGNGRASNNSVNVFSDDHLDSASQQLARYIREVGERYIPSMKVNNVFMQDRLSRGGDHTPFQLEGFAAVRFSTPNENYANQHRATDTLDNMSVPYTVKVAKMNAAAAASLALAPKPPVVLRAAPAPGGDRRGNRGAQPATPAGTTPARAAARTPMIARGSGYDAVLQWRAGGPEEAIQGYAIMIRPTTAPFWEQEIYVGKVNQYTLKDVSIDEVRFGVKAIGTDGSESLVSAYVYPARQKTVIETAQ